MFPFLPEAKAESTVAMAVIATGAIGADPADMLRRVFDYRTSVDPGKVWQDAIEAAMESCRKVVAFLSPAYFSSGECKEELSMARLRHKRENHSVLIPFYVLSLENDAELPLWLQTVTYVDCRQADEAKLAAAAARLI